MKSETPIFPTLYYNDPSKIEKKEEFVIPDSVTNYEELRIKNSIESKFSLEFFDNLCMGKKISQIGMECSRLGIYSNSSLRLKLNMPLIGHDFYELQAFSGYETNCKSQRLPRLSICAVNGICVAYLLESENGLKIENIPVP